MAIIDTALFALPIVALIFSIIELGISAYTVSVTDGIFYTGSLGSRCAFLLFASIWTLLVSTMLIILPMMSARKTGTSRSSTWVTPVTLALNITTMIFWLAGFAALAALFGGETVIGVIGGLLAFAVMLWLIFLALVIINILTALGVVHTDRLGYSAVNGKRTLP